MFCIYCGYELPIGARFCSNCGSSQSAVSQTRISSSVGTAFAGQSSIIPAMCPNCNSHLRVNPSAKIARCEMCGTECLVQEAVKTLNVSGSVHVGNAVINVGKTDVDNYLKRIELMLADEDFKGVMKKCETALDYAPTNGEVYLYMLMASLRCRKRTDLAIQVETFDHNKFYVKALQYGDDRLKKELTNYHSVVSSKNEARLRHLTNGDEFYFGTIHDRKIWWKALDVQEQTALIISSSCILSGSYHAKLGPITWENSTLRCWLNKDFYNACFNKTEQLRIVPRTVHNKSNPVFYTPGGNSTYDKVFLLSINEARLLMSDDEARSTGSRWWLRSSGQYPGFAAFVTETGMVAVQGDSAIKSYCVRPIMCIKLDR